MQEVSQVQGGKVRHGDKLIAACRETAREIGDLEPWIELSNYVQSLEDEASGRDASSGESVE